MATQALNNNPSLTGIGQKRRDWEARQKSELKLATKRRECAKGIRQKIEDHQSLFRDNIRYEMARSIAKHMEDNKYALTVEKLWNKFKIPKNKFENQIGYLAIDLSRSEIDIVLRREKNFSGARTLVLEPRRPYQPHPSEKAEVPTVPPESLLQKINRMEIPKTALRLKTTNTGLREDVLIVPDENYFSEAEWNTLKKILGIKVRTLEELKKIEREKSKMSAKQRARCEEEEEVIVIMCRQNSRCPAKIRRKEIEKVNEEDNK